ncbi:hypothetical protein NM208_g1779 [Fusarium decemcellulare]|uniref:Uncharacterized protein n=2 Tax=Fusarium decemcellulare TaxID=57161 RepID=A0ACC1SUP8_9HYPO|nr:hypothetical protein NM208_g1887 [Fusarium decemcellulare]KAJ3546892.1 hypothetical protein NM208_g1779 [Fusarium decemcellulare]
MDPASLAFGVVSVAIQLMETTAAVKKLIAAYKSAATELEALSCKLDDIETVCHSLQMVLDDFDDTKKPSEIALLKKLHKAIGDCYDKVSGVHDAISMIMSSYNQKTTPFRTLGARFLRHREQIRLCSADLDRSLSSLQLHMTTNILAINLRSSGGSSSVSHPAAVPPDSTPTNKHSITPSVLWKRQQPAEDWEISIKQQTWGWVTVAYLEKKRIQTKSSGSNGLTSSIVQDDLIIFAGAPLFGLYVQLSIRRGSLSPLSVSLEIPCIVDVDIGSSEVGGRLWKAVGNDDLGAVKALFNQGLVTPSTVVVLGCRYPLDSEMSLYGVACYIAKGIFNYPIFDATHTTPVAEVRTTRAVPKKMNLPYGLQVRLELHTAERRLIISVLCERYFGDNWEPFHVCVWSHVLQTFLSSYPDRPYLFCKEKWVPVIKNVLSRGLDIHTTTWPTSSFTAQGQTALQEIFESTDDPDVALELVHNWADLLEQSGVNIQQYLDLEIGPCTRTMLKRYHGRGFSSYNGFFEVREVSGRRLPYWIEIVDDTCPIRDLLTEFPHFKRLESFRSRHMPFGAKEPHKAWKYPSYGSYFWGPVMAPLCRRHADYARYRRVIPESQQLLIEGLDRACDLMDQRLERRQMRKLRKAIHAERRGENRGMPGAWVN